MKGERNYSLTLPPGQRLDRYLSEALANEGEEISRTALQKLIEQGAVGGIPVGKSKPGFKSKIPLEISVVIAAREETKLAAFEADIPVLYEDEYLAIVHKPAGMTVHPGAGTAGDTMVHALIGTIDKLAPHAERPGIVHRLDRETEGLLVVAKTETARSRLGALFAERKIQKSYSALVWGSVALPEDIEGYIWRDPRNRKRMKFGFEPPGSPMRSRTAGLIITRQQAGKLITELEIDLITGRTHQIRATCVHFHAPIIGDTVYGDDAGKYRLYKIGKERRERVSSAGMLLIARAIAFRHPFKRKNLEYEIDLPGRFTEVRDLLG